jgi:serine/threonine protein kinase
MGAIPSSMIKNGKEAPKFFTVAGVPYDRTESGEFLLIYPKHTTLRARLHLTPYPAPLTEDEEEFLDFVKWLLEVNPDSRPYAADALSHVWLRDSYGPYDNP